jgi:hypothetical protein
LLGLFLNFYFAKHSPGPKTAAGAGAKKPTSKKD